MPGEESEFSFSNFEVLKISQAFLLILIKTLIKFEIQNSELVEFNLNKNEAKFSNSSMLNSIISLTHFFSSFLHDIGSNRFIVKINHAGGSSHQIQPIL